LRRLAIFLMRELPFLDSLKAYEKQEGETCGYRRSNKQHRINWFKICNGQRWSQFP